ncbi:MAG: glycosyltransferase family 4 protein [Trueperaceae bacterium]
MRVIINARFLTQKITGVQRYAIELSKRLKILASDIEFIFLAPKNILHTELAQAFNVEVCGYLTGHAWEQLELPFYCRDGVLLNLCNTAPIAKKNQIVTIHDAAVLTVPETFSRAFRTWYQFLLPRLGKASLGILTDSVFSRNELIRYHIAQEQNIHVIYLGGSQLLEHPADTRILEKHDLKSKPFILAVSSLSPSKNFGALVKALNFIETRDFNVVIAGGTNPNIFEVQALPDNVKYLGYVSDGELRALYEHASTYVYPSLYEGFGFTPLEAMTCGCPVVVSNAASLPEVCGDAALYCNPHDPKDIATKIMLLMSSSEKRLELKQKGHEQAKQFSWEKCASETLSVIKKVIE